MRTRSIRWAARLALGLVFLVLGAAMGFRASATVRRGRAEEARRLEQEIAAQQERARAEAIPPAPAAAPVPPTPGREALAAKLARGRVWFEAHRAEIAAVKVKLEDDPSSFDMRDWKMFSEVQIEFVGVEKLALADPAAFLAELRSSDDELWPLVLMLGGLRAFQMSPFDLMAAEGPAPRRRSFRQLPKVLGEGLIDVLRSGSDTQREAVLLYMTVAVKDLPGDCRGACFAVLRDGQRSVQRSALELLTDNWWLITAEEADVLRTSAGTATGSLRHAVIRAMKSIDTPEKEAERLGRLSGAGDVPRAAADDVRDVLWRGWSRMDSETQDRYALALSGAFGRSADPACFRQLVEAALFLRPAKALPLVQQAESRAATPEMRQALGRIAERLQGAETGVRELLEMLPR